MKSACRIVTENRPKVAQSAPIDARIHGSTEEAVRTNAAVRKTRLGYGFLVRRFRRRRGIGRCQRSELAQCVGTTSKKNVKQGNCHDAKEGKGHVLECIGGSLPLATNLDTDTDTFVDVFRTTLIVDAELESVAVFELECARVLVGG